MDTSSGRSNEGLRIIARRSSGGIYGLLPPLSLAAGLLLGTSCGFEGADNSTSFGPSPDLIESRIAAGLPDCPDTDQAANPKPEGLPRTALRCLGSAKIVNLAGLPQRPMVVNLWAQWCGPCREEASFLAEAGSAFADRVGFLGISYFDPHPGLAIEFAALVGWRYPQLTDPEKSLRTPLNVPGLPLTLFVDRQGRIVYRHAGSLKSTVELTELIAKHLEVS